MKWWLIVYIYINKVGCWWIGGYTWNQRFCIVDSGFMQWNDSPYFFVGIVFRWVTRATQNFLVNKRLNYIHNQIATTLLETNIVPFRGFLLTMIGSFSHSTIYEDVFMYIHILYLYTKISAISFLELKKSTHIFFWPFKMKWFLCCYSQSCPLPPLPRCLQGTMNYEVGRWRVDGIPGWWCLGYGWWFRTPIPNHLGWCWDLP